jgi:hypothetical protein
MYESYEDLFLDMLADMRAAYKKYQKDNDEYGFVKEAHNIIDYFNEQKMKMYRGKLA